MDTNGPSTSTDTPARWALRASRRTLGLLGVLGAIAVTTSGTTATGTATGAVFPLDQAQAVVPIDTTNWLGLPGTSGSAPAAETMSLIGCHSLSTWLGVTLPDLAGYTRTCAFYQPSLPSHPGQTVTVLPPRHTASSGKTRPEDSFTAQVFYAPPGVDVHTTPLDLSYQRGLLNVSISDAVTKADTPQQSQTFDNPMAAVTISGTPQRQSRTFDNPLDSVQGGHVSGTLHGRPASVHRTFGDQISVETVLPVGRDALSLQMSSELAPVRAIAAALKVLPS